MFKFNKMSYILVTLIIVLTMSQLSFADSYQIKNVGSNLCLTVKNASKEKGANIIQWTCHEQGNEMWKLKRINEYYQLINFGSNLCLTVKNASKKNDANIIQWTCNEQGNEVWKILLIP